MIPKPDEAIVTLASRIGTRIAPEIQDPYTAVDAGLVSMLLTMLAKETASGVARRMQDGTELKALFETAAQAPGADRRAAFAASAPTSLSLADVSTWLDEGLGLLIELHAWAESHDEALDRAIWDWLAGHTDRHRFDV